MSDTQTEIPTPTCDKLASLSKEKDAIMEFLDWARSERGLALAKHEEDEFYPSSFQGSLEKLVHEFLDIDHRELERERRALLASLGGG